MVAVDERLARFLGEAGEGRVALFAASCVERGAGVFFLATASDSGRASDSDTYLSLLEDLWRGTDLSAGERHDRRECIEVFPELEGDEEPPGIRAFAYDAVAAMYYAYSYLESGDKEDIGYCSTHMLNSAGYIDDAVSDGAGYKDTEIAAQLADIDLLAKGVGEIGMDSIRDRSREVARDRVEALRSVFL